MSELEKIPQKSLVESYGETTVVDVTPIVLSTKLRERVRSVESALLDDITPDIAKMNKAIKLICDGLEDAKFSVGKTREDTTNILEAYPGFEFDAHRAAGFIHSTINNAWKNGIELSQEHASSRMLIEVPSEENKLTQM